MSARATMALAALLVAGSVSTALAMETFDVDLYHGNPNYIPAPTQSVRAQVGAEAAYARAQATPYSAPVQVNRNAVYENGRYIGQDPDPNVRLELRRDFSYQ